MASIWCSKRFGKLACLPSIFATELFPRIGDNSDSTAHSMSGSELTLVRCTAFTIRYSDNGAMSDLTSHEPLGWSLALILERYSRLCRLLLLLQPNA